MTASASPQPPSARSGQLHTALATWIFLVDDAGHHPDDAALTAALAAFRAAGPDASADALGEALVQAVRQGLGDRQDLAGVLAWLQGIFGEARISSDFGEDRDARVQVARRTQFTTNLPWLARVIDRFPGGEVGAHGLLVERIDEQVVCMDPYPWDELDEEYVQPVIEFLVKWELAGGEGVRWVA